MFKGKAKSLAVVLGALLVLGSPILADRTPLRTGWNLFTSQQDVELGRVLIQEGERSLSYSGNDYAHGYINALGNQLAVHAPGYKYPYQFRIYQDPAINSMALPGGMVYVSSGLVLAAQTEPQLAMILAHQIGHIVARHGTQQLSRAYADETNTNRGRVSVPDVLAVLNVGLDPDSVVLKYTTDAEQQADLIATQILYDARFDPRQLPPAFQRLSSQRVSSSQEFFDNHPVPINRVAMVRREFQNLGPLPAVLRGDSPDLHTTQRYLRDERTTSPGDRISDSRISDSNVPVPSTRMVLYEGPDFEFRYPDNWRVTEAGETVTIAPNGGMVSGSMAYGMTISTFQPRSRGFSPQNSFALPGQRSTGITTLSTATDQLIDDLRLSNPNMRVVRTDQKRMDNEPALMTELSNDSPIGGREVNRLFTALRSNGLLYYFLGVAPQRDANRYAPVFDQIINSVRFF